MSERNLEKAALRGEPSYVWRVGQQRRLEMIQSAAGERLRGVILENGCGVGMYVEKLSSFGGKVFGLEFDFERAAEAGSRSPRILNAAGESLPFPPASFDLVLSHEVLEHVADDRLAVCEMVRVLRSPDPVSGKPGGLVTWVLMPPVCLWEMAEIFRGHLRLAFRRFSKNGTRAHLEGLYFTVYYFTPQQIVDWFGAGYDCLAIEGLSVITPTAESKNFAKRFPRLYHVLAWLDDRLSPRPPWQGWGDFFIVTFRYRG